MLKRVLVDVVRHNVFYEELSKALPDITIPDTKSGNRKRQKVDDIKIQAVQGDSMWKWNEPTNSYAAVEIFVVQMNGSVTMKRYQYGTFITAIKKTLEKLDWLQKIAETRSQDWPCQIPSFLYPILCQTQSSFCTATKTDATLCSFMSVGRYIYLQHWQNKNETSFDSALETSVVPSISNLPNHLAVLPSVVVKMVLWHLVSTKVPQNQVLRHIAMIERTLENPNWWSNFMNSTSIQKDKTLVEDLIQILVDPSSKEIKNWLVFFKGLPEMLEYFHGRTKPAKTSKRKIAETSTKNLSFEMAKQILIQEQLWGHLARVWDFAKTIGDPVSVVLFLDQSITTDQVTRTVLLLFDEWGKFWAPHATLSSALGNFVVFRTSRGVMLFMRTSWITEIQERLLIYLCLYPHFRRRYPVPIAPWLTEKYFSGDPRDKEMVIKTFHRLIHTCNRDNKNSAIAEPNEPEFFWVYEHLHEILNHFETTEDILKEFRDVFEDYENLYFQKKKKKGRVEEEVLVGIKNVPCLHRALKSILEIKSPHFLAVEGLEILEKHDLTGMGDLPPAAGPLTDIETMALYKLCATTKLPKRDALALFYYIYVEGEIMFSACLPGMENWSRVSPFLQDYNNKMLKRISDKQEKRQNIPCIALFTCFKVAEEMAHYPFQVKLSDYQQGNFKFRGNLQSTVLHCDPKDFTVRECRCPLMLHADNNKGEPKAWFSDDLFPVYEGVTRGSILNEPRTSFAEHIASSDWKDLRPFEDAHPHLLEYLVT